jgi:hypothetical protein
MATKAKTKEEKTVLGRCSVYFCYSPGFEGHLRPAHDSSPTFVASLSEEQVKKLRDRLGADMNDMRQANERPRKTKKQQKAEWDAYSKAMDAIDKRVEAHIKATGRKNIILDYSAYQTDVIDGVELPIDNLDQVPVRGKVKFIAEPDDFFGGEESQPYVSPVVESPTWLEVCLYANDAILQTNDHHHCFLEGLDVRRVEGDVQIVEFSMGS